MITFTIALLLLIGGYCVYGRYVNRIFAPDDRKTPALTMTDGVDYIPMPTWKLFTIQFLNIAGLGPIFGAIMGAQFGTACYLWIVLGTIFGGAVHDFFSGAISIRHEGESLPEIVGRYLGNRTKQIMCLFSMVLMVLVGAVFVSGPAELLTNMTAEYLDTIFWIVAIFLYYMLATMLPIDKIIGKVYPIFAIALLFMAVGILVMLFVKSPDLPEMWNGFGTRYEKAPIFPMMFISIACGAISGFHATQSPLMARCMKHEKYCRPVFYGAMVTEGIVALVWAAAATYFFQANGTIDTTTGKAFSGAMVATKISKDWLGAFGGLLALIGIVVAPITSGDTALRSARLIVADFFHIDQHPISKRLLVSVPIFIVTVLVLIFSLSNADGFKIIWQYFAWCNQALSVFTLWAITVFLVKRRKNYFITLIPALFMTAVCSTYLCIAPTAFNLGATASYCIGAGCVVVAILWFICWHRKATYCPIEKL